MYIETEEESVNGTEGERVRPRKRVRQNERVNETKGERVCETGGDI